MSQAELQTARELMDEGRNHEAQIILKTIDDPLAVDGLKQLDKSTSSKSIAKYIYFALLWVVVIPIVVVIMLYIKQSNESELAQHRQEALTMWCMTNTESAFTSREDCNEAVKSLSSETDVANIVINCASLYTDDLDSLSICMQEVPRISEQIAELLQHRAELLRQRREITRSNGVGQYGILLEYCSGRVYYLAVATKECDVWATDTSRLTEPIEDASECWGVVELWPIFDEQDIGDRGEVAALECIAKKLGKYFIPMPVIQ